MPKGIPLTAQEQQRRRKEIFEASVHLIFEKGFSNTSMREIAGAAGVGKSTLYDYFKSKEDILISYFESEIRKITERARKIVELDLEVSERLRKIMQMHLEYLVDNKKFYLKLTMEAQILSLGSQQIIQAQRHTYQDMLCSLIEEGIKTGEFRSINPLFAARSIFSLLSTAVFTSRPSGTPDEMMDDVVNIFFMGIQA